MSRCVFLIERARQQAIHGLDLGLDLPEFSAVAPAVFGGHDLFVIGSLHVSETQACSTNFIATDSAENNGAYSVDEHWEKEERER